MEKIADCFACDPVDLYREITDNRILQILRDRLSEKISDKLPEKELLSYHIQNPGYTVSQQSENNEVSRQTIVGHFLKALKYKGIIERVGSARNGY